MNLKFVTLVSLFFLPLSITLAQPRAIDVKNNPRIPTPEVKENMRDKIASTSQKIEERRDDRREQLISVAKIRLSKMIERFESTLERFESITSKIISRVEKVKSGGGNTIEAEKNIENAKISFDKARVALVSLKNASSSAETLVDASISTSTSARNKLKLIKDLSETFIKNIREGHDSLTKAVKSLRGMSSTNSTTTPKITN